MANICSKNLICESRRLPNAGLLGLAVVVYLTFSSAAHGHGGVVYEEDLCVLNVGFLQAHFTGYQPQSSGGAEFCEDIPEVGESVFVLEYLHDFMREMAVDFRIVRDVQEFDVYANWEDVQTMGDLAPHTVFYLPAARYVDGVLTARHDFTEAGGYIGVVTAQHPEQNKVYNAVFFFRVGGRSYWPLVVFAGVVVLVQLGYLASTGSLQRFVRKHFSTAQ